MSSSAVLQKELEAFFEGVNGVTPSDDEKEQHQQLVKMLILDVKTRWSSTHQMMGMFNSFHCLFLHSNFGRACFTIPQSGRCHCGSNADSRYLNSNNVASRLECNLPRRGMALAFSCSNHTDVQHLDNYIIERVRHFQDASRPPSHLSQKSSR